MHVDFALGVIGLFLAFICHILSFAFSFSREKLPSLIPVFVALLVI